LVLKTIQTLNADSPMVASSVAAAERGGSAGSRSEIVLEVEENAASTSREKRKQELAALRNSK
jgi:hypothetical protein